MIKNVDRVYVDAHGNEIEALKDVNLDIRPGQFISFIGPSGCGKTTLLRLIAGLDEPQNGQIYLDGELVKGTHYERGLVFQQANLFPWMTIEENIACGPKARGIYRYSTEEIREFIELVGLKGFEESYPHQVSGGMAQRASLARALINHPRVLLLDEPLGALDAFTRMNLQDELLRLWLERNTTMILVTHDVDEAVYLSDQIVVMTPRPGKIVQIVNVEIGRPRDRSDADFIQIRSKILKILQFAGEKKSPEYYL
ncbi:ABC transporter ATP-binding protein [Bacillota bacterium LX-D]|nr:ABC transporter ATP-binding protein [Bacillota bacterium LX-D]